MKKKIIAVISIFAFILLQANLVSGLTTIDTSLNNELNRMLSYNTADDISGEPAAAEPNTYSLLGNPGWEYGYKILEISANRYEITLSNDRMENTAGAGDIELDPPTEESLRDFFTWYEVAPEFKVVDGFTSSYSKSTTPGEYQPYTLVSEDLVMPSGNPRFTPGLISSGIENGAIPLTSDDTNGIYSWKGDAHLPADYTSFFPDVVKNDYKGVLELEPYVYGTLTPHKKAGASWLLRGGDGENKYINKGDGSIDGRGFELYHTFYSPNTIDVAQPSIAITQKFYNDSSLNIEYTNGETIDGSQDKIYSKIEITNNGQLPYEASISVSNNLKNVKINNIESQDIRADEAVSVGEINKGETIIVVAEVDIVENGVLDNKVTASSATPFQEYAVQIVNNDSGIGEDTYFENKLVKEFTPTMAVSNSVEVTNYETSTLEPEVVEPIKPEDKSRTIETGDTTSKEILFLLIVISTIALISLIMLEKRKTKKA